MDQGSGKYHLNKIPAEYIPYTPCDAVQIWVSLNSMDLLSKVPVFVLCMGARIALMRGEPRGEEVLCRVSLVAARQLARPPIIQ